MFFHVFHDILKGFLLLDVHPVTDVLLVLPIVHHLEYACGLSQLLINVLMSSSVLVVRCGCQSCL